MKNLKKLTALLLALTLVLALGSACANTNDETETADTSTAGTTDAAAPSDTTNADDAAPEADPAEAADHTLRIGVTTANSTHDPMALVGCMYQTDSVFESLFRMNVETQEPEPWLAESAEYLDDLTLQVKLRQDVYFTNGQQMTAADVLYSYRDVAAVNSATYYKNYDFDKTEVVDEFTLNFAFYEKYSPTLVWMANTPIYCAADCAGAAALNADQWMSEPNGTGPYTCVENVASAYVTYALKSAEQYWGTLPDCTQVTYKYYSETTTMFIDFENGNLDVANCVGSSDAERVLAGDCPAFTGYYVNAYNDVLLAVLPEETAAFDDIRVREAFFKSIDAESVAVAVFGSMYLPADSILPSTLTKYHASQEVVAYDPEGANALLDQAGYPDGVELRLIVTIDLKDVAESLQAYLATGGFHVTVESYEFGTAIPMLRNMESDFVVTQTVDGAYAYEPSQAIPITWGPESTYQPVGMDDAAWAENFELALSTEGEERIAAYHGLQEWAAEEYRFLPLCERASMTVYNADKLASFEMEVANRPMARCAVFK